MTDNDLCGAFLGDHECGLPSGHNGAHSCAADLAAVLRARDTELAAARTFIIDVARTLPTSTEEVYQAFYLFKHRAEVLAGTTESSVSPPAASAKSET